MAFFIVAILSLVLNAVFLLGSLIYTINDSKRKVDSTLSLKPSRFSAQLGSRMSLQPQMVMCEALIRFSGDYVPGVIHQQPNQPVLTEKQEGWPISSRM